MVEQFRALDPVGRAELLNMLTPKERAELDSLLVMPRRWEPLPGPQTLAYESEADILLYGGAAGGGKTDLLLGLAKTRHWKAVIFRRIFPSLTGIIERSRAIYAGGDFVEGKYRWRFNDGRSVRFGHLQHEDNKQDWQGQDHDYYGFDEITEFTETQFRFVTGWNRSTKPGQRCRVVCTGNPPHSADGEWVIEFWGPWLKADHPRPAKPGELRWYTTVKGKDVEQPNGDPVLIEGEWVKPLSRTFIPAKVQDNPFLIESGYVSRLQAMPEPLRSKMLYGDFTAGREDDAYQVIPSAWVRAAQKRWRERARPTTPMSALGCDPSRGGEDETVISRRHDNWFDELLCYPGESVPNGPAVATLILQARKDRCKVQVDVIGVGCSVYDQLEPILKRGVVGLNGAEGSDQRDASGQLGFINLRAEMYWKMREALDPSSGQDLALPPDPQLLADLCAPRWKLTARGIQVESKEDLAKRLGRSPDRGDAVIYAHAIKHIEGEGLLDYYKQAAEALKKKREGKAA